MWNAPTAFRLLYPKPESKISVPLNPEESPEMKSFRYIWFLYPASHPWVPPWRDCRPLEVLTIGKGGPFSNRPATCPQAAFKVMTPTVNLSTKRQDASRSLICHWAIRDLRMTAVVISKLLGISQSAVTRAASRGEAIAAADGLELVLRIKT
jgi:hypothetical protein